MPTEKLVYAYPLSGGGSEYTFGDYVWTVVRGPAGGWEITVVRWSDDLDIPAQVMATGFLTAEAAERALITNRPPMYSTAGKPLP
jgi:hypothetical protein